VGASETASHPAQSGEPPTRLTMPAQPELPLCPPAPRSALNAPGTALGEPPLSQHSLPIKTAGEPLPGAKTPPSGGGLTLRESGSKSLTAGAVAVVPLRGWVAKVPLREGRSRIETKKADRLPQSLPGVPPALARRLWPILKRAGYVVPGDPAWRSPAELAAWFAAPRAELGGRAWAQVHVPFTLEGRMRFAHAMDAIDRESVEVPA
jgi:hypothetical protein